MLRMSGHSSGNAPENHTNEITSHNYSIPSAYVFLVPDGGYADLSLLHDRLYGGVLAPFLRLDVPFTPHINIGTLSDRTEAKKLCDSLNQEGVSVPGRVGALIVGDLEDGKIVDLASFELRGADPSVVSA